jgi:GTPase SAR1 family protein
MISVFDLTDKSTHDSAKRWIEQIRDLNHNPHLTGLYHYLAHLISV